MPHARAWRSRITSFRGAGPVNAVAIAAAALETPAAAGVSADAREAGTDGHGVYVCVRMCVCMHACMFVVCMYVV